MEPLPENLDFIGGLLRRPGMYVFGNHFEGVANLMFGMKISSQQARYHDPEVARWDEFLSYLAHKYAERLRAGVLPEYLSWHENDKDALRALTADYDEFLKTRTTPEILVVNHFQAVLLHPHLYAKNWDEFCGMVRGIWAFAGRETHRRDVALDWEEFQRWLVNRQPDLNSDDGPGDVLDALRAQCPTDQEAFALFGQQYRTFKGF